MSTAIKTEFEFMNLAISVMLRTKGYPKVGAVLVKGGKVLSTGYRHEVSNKHAERVAVEKVAGADVLGATLYTTLEPCVDVAESQAECSCSSLLVDSNIAFVCIGAFDPNGKIYANGWKKLRDSGIHVKFFDLRYQAEIQQKTFRYDDFNIGYGSGSRRVRLGTNQKTFIVFFSESDDRYIDFRWSRLSQPKDRIDLVSANEAIRVATNARTFNEITAPLAYHDPSHFARLAVDEIAVICPIASSMMILIKITNISASDIEFKWQVRKK